MVSFNFGKIFTKMRTKPVVITSYIYKIKRFGGQKYKMRVCKSQCSMFKELYKAFIKEEVDKETKKWMTEHKKECSFCREWAKNFEENKEDVVKDEHLNKNKSIDTKEVIDRIKITVTVSAGIIIFIVLWASAHIVA